MNQSSVLQLARQGDADAIARLLNQALEPRGVRVRTLREQNCLHVLLEAANVPNQQLARVVRGGITCLGTQSIHLLRVYGRKRSQTLPAWTEEWNLRSASPHLVDQALASTPASSTRANGTQTNSTQAATILPPPSSQFNNPDILRVATPSKQSTASPRAVDSRKIQRTVARAQNSGSKVKWLIPLTFAAGFVTGIGWNRLFTNASDAQNAPVNQSFLNSSSQANSNNGAIALTPSVISSAPIPPPLEAPPAGVPPAPDQTEPLITIKAVGDIIPGTNFPSNRLPDQDGQWLFDNVKGFLGDSDLLFGNFESTLTDYPYAAKDISQGQTFAFRTPPSYATLLQQLGFDVLSVANNHSLDFGDQGFADTIAHIQQAGMQAVGRKDEIIYRTVNGVNLAFIGFSYFPDHNSILDLDAGRNLVEQAKQQADIVIISVHAGAEGTDAIHTRNETEFFFGENRGNLVEFARAMVDQGADLILGHGPHVPRAIELYKSRLIAYSLGNFMGYRTLSTDGTLSYSLILQVQMDSEGVFTTGKIIPVRLNSQGVPYIDDNFTSVPFIRNLLESDFPGTPLLIDEAGQILKNEAPI
ncbi:MAG: hypothetical protein Kow00121_43180 [Elainellaceae cyanobacterium]